MSINEMIYITAAFFIIGMVIASIGLFLCRFRIFVHRKKKGFSRPVKYKPSVDLSYSKPQESIDNSNAIDEFVHH